MKDYKRITKQKFTKENCPIVFDAFGNAYFDKELVEFFIKEHNRLFDFETKIENGTLVVVNQPFVVLDYISNGQKYYAVRIAEEKDLDINLTKAEAEKKWRS